MRKFFQIYSKRINYLTIGIFSFSFIVLSLFFNIQIIKQEEIKKKVATKGYRLTNIYGKRGEITDTKNNILSESITKYDFWVNTKKPFDQYKIARLLSENFNKPDSHYTKLLEKKSNSIKLEKDILFLESKKILDNLDDIQGLNYTKKNKRFYPNNYLACQTLGYVDFDGNGKGGIEGNFNTILSGDTIQVKLRKGAKGKYYNQILNFQENINGSNIQLTLDIELQKILQEELEKATLKTKSKSANGIILNPFTGDILAMASIPHFNPNRYYEYDIQNYKNHVISDAYEPGSTFKIIPMLASLDNNNSLNEKYYCENGVFNLTSKNKLHDHEPHDSLTIKEIFIHSSNIGISKTVNNLSNIDIYKLCKNFGFGSKTGLPFKNESKGKLRSLKNWSKTSKTYVSIGQEVGVTNMQLALAYCAIANGGYLLKPNIIKTIKNNDQIIYNRKIEPIRKVINSENSKTILTMLNEVVNLGTAKSLDLNGYKIGGKTGTAQKFINGGYSKNEFISSFTSIFPIDRPKYVMVVSIDSPIYGKHWSNESAVPLSKNIISRIIVNDNYLYDNNKTAILAANKETKNQKNNSYNAIIYTRNIQQDKTPNFRGKSLREALKISNLVGLKLQPDKLSGKIIWQSIKPGTKISDEKICKVKMSI